MNIFDTANPTTIGMIILMALIVLGVITFSRLLKPIERKAKQTLKSNRATSIAKMRPIDPVTPTGEQPQLKKISATDQNSNGPELGNQWDRIEAHLDTGSAGINQAALDHASASTQLHAAEFSLSELFREFPDARDAINPVTYVEFPDNQSRNAPDLNSPDQQDDQRKTVSAASA